MDCSTTPASFCCICTRSCFDDFAVFIKSLSLHHPGAKVFCMADYATFESFKTTGLSDVVGVDLDIDWIISLDNYTNIQREHLDDKLLAQEFWGKKADVISYALERTSDTLFLGVDVFLMGKIDCIDKTKQIGLSPHYIPKHMTDVYGFYNADVLWTRDKSVPEAWKMHNKDSRYYDQASLEDLARAYTSFKFPDNYNVSWWVKSRYSRLKAGDGVLLLGKAPVKFVQTHFYKPYLSRFNGTVIDLLRASGMHKELDCLNLIF